MGFPSSCARRGPAAGVAGGRNASWTPTQGTWRTKSSRCPPLREPMVTLDLDHRRTVNGGKGRHGCGRIAASW